MIHGRAKKFGTDINSSERDTAKWVSSLPGYGRTLKSVADNGESVKTVVHVAQKKSERYRIYQSINLYESYEALRRITVSRKGTTRGVIHPALLPIYIVKKVT